ncbi:hypothetical protein [Arthrobacter sp. H20]|uniref:hypothetical protein n=1 Tax=Arthrobacter sp. H20 TaxID=1267981 RepID=UPI00047DAB79|nr:hypothetical protein [Arthrobacter sp. H20]
MLSQLLNATLVASETGGEHGGHVELPMDPVLYGIIIMGALLALMLITLAFSSLGNRHEAVEEHADPHKQHPNKHDPGDASRR